MGIESKWYSVCEASERLRKEDWPILNGYYEKNQLAYHNWDHIADCLQKFSSVSNLAEDPLAVELAIWFHDVVYEPLAKDNEERSADLAEEFIQNRPLLETVQELIRDTKHRVPAQSNDGKLICDIDLSILGSSPESYQRYSRAIRQEYPEISEQDYNAGRSKVLEHFLSRERIYQLPLFIERYEGPARKNLAFELTLLAQS